MSERVIPQAGEKAPSLRLKDAAGRTHALTQHAGRKVIVYFYPKDDTPGCTTQACDFRDAMSRLEQLGVDVIGVSPDESEHHARFAEKHGLPFTLLSDPDHDTMEAWGAWGEKTLYGKATSGVIRSSYLIDSRGKIVKAWPNVKAKGHVAQVISALEG